MQNRLEIALALALLFGAHAHATPTIVEVVVADAEHLNELEYTLNDREAQAVARNPRAIEALTERAKSDFAEGLGYSRARYGKQNWKILSGLKVQSMKLKVGARVTDLRPGGSASGTSSGRIGLETDEAGE